ncbi:probable protein phosphatase 2C 33 [Solanum dulcamara]|uniref:probable protein phosphatase 2C 33 n=1 Tax=Solanum dulcamara TaxID=45834 RepID=UPI002486794D|nr:probable protein phosphatase 2C 33 [Solanum dulcamara]
MCEDVLREISLNTGSSLYPEHAFPISAEDSRFSIDVEETEKYLEVFQTLEELFLKAYKVMDRELSSYTNIDCFCSGTTEVTMVKQGKNFVICNIGNSRAVLATRRGDDSLTAVQLTVDLKPNLPAEAERIRKCIVRVFSLLDEPDVARVWMPYNNSPGLAMTRAFGDFCLKNFGVLSLDHSLKKPFEPGRLPYPTCRVNDCAFVCLFLDSNPNNFSTASSTKDKDKAFISMEMSEVSNDMDGVSSPPALNRSSTVREGEEVSASIKEEASEQDLRWEKSRVITVMTLPSWRRKKKYLLAGVPGAGGFDAVTLGASSKSLLNVLAMIVTEGVSWEDNDPRAKEITAAVSSIQLQYFHHAM